MARTYLFTHPNIRVLHSVEHPVGTGCANRFDDVLLVQFFLRVAYDDGRGVTGYRPPGQGIISVDGQCGPQTIAYIRYFQKEYGGLVQDGRIDPVANGTVVGSASKCMYTIMALNNAYKSRRSPEALLDLMSDRYYHPGLTKALYIIGTG